MLLLLARLGLRAPEVVAIQLDDIDWRAGELLVRGKGSGTTACRFRPTLARRWPIISATTVSRIAQSLFVTAARAAQPVQRRPDAQP